MATLTITPRTSGTLAVLIQQDNGGVMQGVLTATCAADVFLPSGQRVASAVTMTGIGGGYYTLVIDPAWSLDALGRTISGKFRAVVTATLSGEIFTDAFDFDVKF